MRKARLAQGLLGAVGVAALISMGGSSISGQAGCGATNPNCGPGGSTFELEGNAVDDSVPGDDWNTTGGAAGVGGARTEAFVADGSGNATIFTVGSKDIDDVSAWSWKDNAGGLPDKDNITNAYARAYDVNNQQILYFGLDRYANDGDAQLGFWFFHQNVTTVGNGKGSFSGSHQTAAQANSTVGDLLILANLTNGGATSTIQVLEWVGSGGDQGGGQLRTVVSDADAKCGTNPDPNACAISNPGARGVPATNGTHAWSYTPKQGTAGTFPTFSFFEGGLNTTALFGGEPCFASFMAETRSSQSPTATLKDFALGAFPVCGGGLQVNKVTIDRNGNPFTGTEVFPYTIRRADGSNMSTNSTVTNITTTQLNDAVFTTYGDMRLGTNYTLAEDSCAVGANCAAIGLYKLVSIICTAPNGTSYGTGQQFPVVQGGVTSCTVTNRIEATPAETTVPAARVFLNDSVTITGILYKGQTLAPSVTFGLFNDNLCTSAVTGASAISATLQYNAPANTSATATTEENRPGGVQVFNFEPSKTYYWKVSYAGDNFNSPFVTCGAGAIGNLESTTVAVSHTK
jgi:hypothetical protein